MRLRLEIISVILLLLSVCDIKLVSTIEYRLNKDVIPLHYNISLTPYFLPEDGNKLFSFYGETNITIINTNKTTIHEFALHVQNLNLSDIDFRSANGNKIEFTHEYEVLTDKLIFHTKEGVLPLITHSLSFKYTGLIFNEFEGLYRLNYTDDKAYEKFILSSQLQRINARKVFPCFDEPSFKAYFTVQVSRPKSYRSFSNTALLYTRTDRAEINRCIDHFDTTPFMSTYLLAIIIADYKPRGDDNLFIISRPEYYNKTEFSLQVARKVLNGYNELFGIPYSKLGNTILQKASLPKFIHNGMENWGLTIYKDEVLIFEENNTDIFDMQYMTAIISHETSHSWFGNSFTFEWWGYFWLNEGFARYYQYFATQMFFPEYNLDKQFIVDQLQSIFIKDAGNSSQPLSESNVASPSEIAEKFSSITYVKGASVIRMISHAMSEPNFQKAVRNYIQNSISSSVKPSHLFKYLKLNWPSPIIVNVTEFLHDWTEQVGFPLLNVTLSNDLLKVKLTQSRYLENPKDGSDPNLRYTIPLTFTTNLQKDFNNTFPTAYFKKHQNNVVFDLEAPISWIVFNIQQTAYYRVIYDRQLYDNLFVALCKENWSGIHEINRAQLVDDLFSYGKTGLYSYDLIFEWLEYLKTETEYLPWKAACNGIAYIGEFLTVEEHLTFGKFILNMTDKIYFELGVNGMSDDSILNIYNRNGMVNLNCKYRRKHCTNEIGKTLTKFLYNGIKIPVNMRSTVYCNGMRDASEIDFDKMVIQFKFENVSRERMRMIKGLGCVRNEKNIEKLLHFILSDSVTETEKKEALNSLYKENPENAWSTYKIITSRWNEYVERFGSLEDATDQLCNIATLLTTEEQKNLFAEFVRQSEKYTNKLKLCLQKLEKKLEWSKSHLTPLRSYLEKWRNI